MSLARISDQTFKVFLRPGKPSQGFAIRLAWNNYRVGLISLFLRAHDVLRLLHQPGSDLYSPGKAIKNTVSKVPG